MSYKRLGDYVRLVSFKNTDLKVSKLLGVSIKKKFIDSVANIDGTDMKNYRVIKKNQFAYSPVTSRNGEKITIALLKEYDEALLSPMYTVFEVNDSSKLIPEYIFLWFNRAEFDRYSRFNSWGSARETFSWEDLCDVMLPIPDDIDEQRKYVNIYQGVLNNQKCYEKSLDDLQLICDTYIENLIKTEEPKTLGDYIEKTDNKNTSYKYNNVKGMSVLKKFRTPSTKVNMSNLSNYRVVHKNEFGYVQTTNNEKVLIVCLSKFEEPILISSVHIVFKIKEEKKQELLPEYLHLFLRRKDMDRYARFHSWGSARETFNWDDMCDVKLPIPDIKVQEAIITIYNTLETRKRLNEELKAKIKPLCPVLMSGVVENRPKPQTV
jgi:type I restriction enzyme, S subunit